MRMMAQRTNAAREPAATRPHAVAKAPSLGNQARLRQLSAPRIQAKLTIGAVNDPLEHEADAVAEIVMRMPDPALSLQTAPLQVSRKCAACDEDEKLRPKRAEGNDAGGVTSEPMGERVSDPSEPLEQNAGRIASQVMGAPAPATAPVQLFGSVGQTQSARQAAAHTPARPTRAPAFAPRGNQASLRRLQAKLTIGAVDDPLEREADEVAEKVMRMPAAGLVLSIAPVSLRRTCAECEAEEAALQREADGAPIAFEGDVPASVPRVLQGAGSSLDTEARAFFEPRFGADFSAVRVHYDGQAAQSAREVAAHAYAVGNHVVFAAGRFAPATSDGRRLLAHELAHTLQQRRLVAPELTHVLQQRRGDDAHALRRQGAPGQPSASEQSQVACVVREGGCAMSRDGGNPPVEDIEKYNKTCAAETHYSGQDIFPTDEQCRNPTGDPAVACAELESACRSTPAYGTLVDADKKLAEDIINVLGSLAVDERLRLLGKLKQLFDTPVKPPATITAETNASTQSAATKEQARLAVPTEAANTGAEEKASKDPARKWTRKEGKFGGGHYYVDNTSPAHIFVKAEIFLHPAGTGTDADVEKVKSMEDAIEKAASAPGYSVDIIFVNAKTADSFDVGVDPGSWEVASNWAGGGPTGYAHELHHLMAFELDKYNYIDSHSTNTSMAVSQRLIWFRKELDKPAGYNDPTSIMNKAPHPNDIDACTVAGLDPATCAASRQKARQP